MLVSKGQHGRGGARLELWAMGYLGYQAICSQTLGVFLNSLLPTPGLEGSTLRSVLQADWTRGPRWVYFRQVIKR